MGRTHLAAYAAADGCEVRAVHDPVITAAPTGNLVTGGGSAEELLANIPREPTVAALLARHDIELVSICTPTDSHVALVRAAIAAGKHVLVEKPTALDPEEIDALAREAKDAGVVVMPAHCMRFWPAWAWMAQAVREGRLGKPLRASFRRLGARPGWSQDFYLDVRRSGGAIIDLHIHDADFVRFCFGEPDAVEASGSAMHVLASYRYRSGLRVDAEGGWIDNPDFAFTMTARIECERGTLDFDLGRSPELVMEVQGHTTPVAAGQEYPLGSGYEKEIYDLLTVLRAHGTAPSVTLAEAAATQRLLMREIDCIRRGAPRSEERRGAPAP